jgi:hypothetical protein
MQLVYKYGTYCNQDKIYEASLYFEKLQEIADNYEKMINSPQYRFLQPRDYEA